MKRKPINMATGGLMSMPPYIKSKDKSDEGITPYDISTPESARKGLPSRLLSKSRTRFSKGKEAKKDEVPIWDEDDWEDLNAPEEKPLKVAKLNIKEKGLYKTLKGMEASDVLDEKGKKILKKLEQKKNQKALGGYMDENDIAEQTPLALNIGGAVGRPEERKDYKAYAEGDLVDEEIVEDDIIEDEVVDESLMAPTGLEDSLIGDEIATDEFAEEDIIDDDEVDSVLDTSMLSEEEEIVLDEAVEMHPELEAIIPKIVASEFTEDELVEGPGDGTSDSIPAMLSDGEFVFTAKAVKSLGVDKLRKMMAQAEEAYDAGEINQEEAALGAEESLLV
jgi:hypothetical protein